MRRVPFGLALVLLGIAVGPAAALETLRLSNCTGTPLVVTIYNEIDLVCWIPAQEATIPACGTRSFDCSYPQCKVRFASPVGNCNNTHLVRGVRTYTKDADQSDLHDTTEVRALELSIYWDKRCDCREDEMQW
jgi:hypothetical protein